VRAERKVFWCMKCGNKLKLPLSVARGYGPDCWNTNWRLGVKQSVVPEEFTSRFLIAVAGQNLLLGSFQSAGGKECLALLDKQQDNTYWRGSDGVHLPALAGKLPDRVTLICLDDETRVPLNMSAEITEAGISTATFRGIRYIPGLGDSDIRVRFSQHKSSWTSEVEITPVGEGLGEARFAGHSLLRAGDS
jgi:hypothetical protein